jgi:hypothetical protein
VREKKHRQHSGEPDQAGEVGGDKTGDPEGAQWQDRIGDEALGDDECRKQSGRTGELQPCRRRAPSLGWCFHEREHEQQHAAGHDR